MEFLIKFVCRWPLNGPSDAYHKEAIETDEIKINNRLLRVALEIPGISVVIKAV